MSDQEEWPVGTVVRILSGARRHDSPLDGVLSPTVGKMYRVVLSGLDLDGELWLVPLDESTSTRCCLPDRVERIIGGTIASGPKGLQPDASGQPVLRVQVRLFLGDRDVTDELAPLIGGRS